MYVIYVLKMEFGIDNEWGKNEVEGNDRNHWKINFCNFLVATSTLQRRKVSPCLLPIVVIAVIVIQINVAMPQLPWFHRCPLFRCNDDTAKLCVNSRSIITIQKIIVCHFATVAAVLLAMLQQLSTTQPLCCHHCPCTVCLCCCCLELIVFSAYIFSLQ